MRLRDGVLTAIAGASRSGKSGWLKDKLKGVKRQFIWDVKGEYQCTVRITNINHLIDAVNHFKHNAGVIAYTGNIEEFDKFCECAYMWCRLGNRAGVYSTIICEELADVTHQGKAPKHWGMIIRKALGYATDIYALSQSPAESDKTTWRNASLIHCCRLNTPADRKTMSQTMDVPLQDIESLKADVSTLKFEYIERDQRTHKVKKGIWTPR